MPKQVEQVDYKDTMKAEYAGDGVYVINHGFAVELRANDPRSPTDTITLEPNIIYALLMILKRWGHLPTV